MRRLFLRAGRLQLHFDVTLLLGAESDLQVAAAKKLVPDAKGPDPRWNVVEVEFAIRIGHGMVGILRNEQVCMHPGVPDVAVQVNQSGVEQRLLDGSILQDSDVEK